jgi:hypothetical protein
MSQLIALDLRPSSLDRVAICPASAVEGASPSEGPAVVSLGSEATAQGTALDVAIGRGVAKRDTSLVDSRLYSAEFGVELDPKEFPAAVQWGVAWMLEHMPGAKWQVPLKTGTADGVEVVLGDDLSVDVVKLVDCKATAVGGDAPDDRMQQVCYVSELSEIHKPREIRSAVLYPFQRQSSEWVVYDRQAQERAIEIVGAVRMRGMEQAKLDQSRRSYRTGDHCKFCRGFSRCPAIVQELSKIETVLDAIKTTGGVPIAAPDLPRVYAMVTQVVNTLDGKDSPWKRFVKESVEKFGEIDGGEYGVLKISGRATNPKVSYDQAVAWLRARDTALAEAMDKELHDALPPPGRITFPKLFPQKREKS